MTTCIHDRNVSSCQPCAACKKLEKLKVKDFDSVAKEHGMDPAHARAISRVSANHNVTTSWRKTSPECLRRVHDGHPTKGHDVTYKTLKEDTLDMKEPDKTEFLKEFGGLVAKYNPDVPPAKKGKVIGFVSNEKSPSSDEPRKIITVADPWNGQKIEPGLMKTIFTGDYDMHDMIQENGTRVPPGSDLANLLLFSMNNAMLRSNLPKGVSPYDSEYQMVRHEDQANYPEYCKIHDESADPGVLRPDPDILVFANDGEAYLLQHQSAILDFYDCKKAKAPPDWEWEKPWLKKLADASQNPMYPPDYKPSSNQLKRKPNKKE